MVTDFGGDGMRGGGLGVSSTTPDDLVVALKQVR